MQGIDLNNIEAHISTPRLKTYTTLTGSSSDKTALIGAYQWNKHVASSIYPILQCLEVSLRNAVHMAATSHFGNNDWFDPVMKIAGHKFYQADMTKNSHKNGQYYRNGFSKGPKGSLKIWTSHHENMIKTARDQLQRDRKKVTADAVIGELMMGFWVGIFTAHYNDINSKNLLWPHLLKEVFPNLNSSQQIASQIHIKLDAIKDLRNRLSHHEPVWKHKYVANSTDAINYLNRVVDDAISLIYGISKDRKKLLYESGRISYFKSVCQKDTLDYYLNGITAFKCDKRRLKKYVYKAINSPLTMPVIIMDKNQPKFLIDLWLP